MPMTVYDSKLFGHMFNTKEIQIIFSDNTLIQKYIDVEIALAKAQADCEVIPKHAAEQIEKTALFDRLDLTLMQQQTEIVGYPILPLVEQLSKICGEAGKYVHWGATTQDIMDTATILQIKDAILIVERDIQALRELLRGLAKKYRNTPMVGRTHLQQALPITFGYKCAVWLSMFDRHLLRLQEIKPRLFVGEFAGAAGTLASLGTKGLIVQQKMMEILSLGVPQITWHVARDNLVEVVNFLSIVTGSLGKIALDISLMMSNEFAEVSEPFIQGRGASSTMPQKRNPISCELISACAKGVRQQAALMADAMIQDFERSTGPWQAEWIAIPQSFALTASALNQAKFILAGLEVHTENMRKNLHLSKGLIVSEAVMMELAPYLGRQTAHDVVYDACRLAIKENITLHQALVKNQEITKHLTEEQLSILTNPENYVGLASEMADKAIEYSVKIK